MANKKTVIKPTLANTRLLLSLLLGLPSVVFISVILLFSQQIKAKFIKTPVTEAPIVKSDRIEFHEGQINISSPLSGNDIMDQAITDYINTYKANFQSAKGDSVFKQIPFELQINGTLTTVGQYQSLELAIYDYEGGAHGINFAHTMVFDQKAEKFLALGDLFSSPDYLQVVSTAVRDSLHANKNEFFDPTYFVSDWYTAGTGPDIKNFTNWIITDSGVEVIFNPYDIAPYVVGQIRAPLTWQSLQSASPKVTHK